jgi:hypothetical protein
MMRRLTNPVTLRDNNGMFLGRQQASSGGHLNGSCWDGSPPVAPAAVSHESV